jgi:hypothetical protein
MLLNVNTMLWCGDLIWLMGPPVSYDNKLTNPIKCCLQTHQNKNMTVNEQCLYNMHQNKLYNLFGAVIRYV